jgi:hypothetical protein
MKRIIQTALLMACVLGLGLGQPAYAAQFNVTVPVNLYKLPSSITHVIVKGFLICGHRPSVTGESVGGSSLWDMQAGGSFGQRQIVGVGQQIRSVDTSTGEFHSSITLNLSVAPGYFPNNVGGYFYKFRLQENGVVVDPSTIDGLDDTQVFAPNDSYVGDFSNPALVGTQCDQEDFNR